jgi:NAD(P)-dependent dehydrogenase (short-subunit alcohol dehydrogenase family)
LPDEVVLITGAASGFGERTASLLAQKGYRVYGTSRKAHSSGHEGVSMLELEVSSDQSVERCISSLLEKTGRIDVLVNNAGQALIGGLEETSVDEAMAHLNTNLFGAVRMVNSVLPGMRNRKSGRIINIASIAGTFPVPFEGYYGVAKAALIAYSDVLRQEVKSLGIKVSVVEPGFFRTNLGNARVAAKNRIPDYDGPRGRAHEALQKSFEEGGDPQEVAEIILKIIETPSPSLHYLVGREKRYVTLKRILPASMLESRLRKHWRLD